MDINKIDYNKLPQHIAIIMDGNGRWAKTKGKFRIFGHQNGITSVRETIETAAELKIKHVTLYAFSTENWNRPKSEIDGLMNLLVNTINNEYETLMKNNIKLNSIGDISKLPIECHHKLKEVIEKTQNNSNTSLTLALSYSGRWEIIEVVKKIIKDNISINDISEDLFSQYLTPNNVPFPELLIRTGGEKRISNFLLWQIAYSELYFSDKLWPEFRREDLLQAIIDFQKRERRFGKTTEQIKN